MKTREKIIEVAVQNRWLHDPVVMGAIGPSVDYAEKVYPSDGFTMCKLIIEIPERKIEITESEFDELVKEWNTTAEFAPRFFRNKLFGKDN